MTNISKITQKKFRDTIILRDSGRYNQYFLQNRVTYSVIEQILSGNLTMLDGDPLNYAILWNLPIPYDDAIRTVKNIILNK